MKKLTLYSLLMLSLAAAFNACKKEPNVTQKEIDPASAGIIGKWIGVFPGPSDKSFQDMYIFNADSTFSETRLKVDTVSGQPISYQYLGTGKFHLNADNLVLYNVVAKASNNYGPLNQLTVIEQLTSTTRYTVAFDTETKSFHFVFPPCPINANCLAALTYVKKQ